MRSVLNQFSPLSEAAWQDFAAGLELIRVRRKQLITRQGEVERYMYFVVEGIQRGFYLRDDKDFTIAFSFNHSFSGIPESFFTQTPSNCFLEALTPGMLLRHDHDRLMRLFDTHHDLERVMRIATQQILAGMTERLYQIQALTAEERFRALAARSPHVLNLIPQKYLASYLGMNPATFSTLMNSIKLGED
ncbi:MAG: Crp/Fnr family transcriptional regulator [Bacteroidia bacterium]|nr:Crp/Fnr family transcriptional regulator [Bacteroidia bacterium]